MNREQIEKLIDKLSDKTLSFGCLVKCKKAINTIRKNTMLYFAGCGKMPEKRKVVLFYPKARKERNEAVTPHENIWLDYYEVIGHPVLLGDVLERIEKEDCRNLIKAGFDRETRVGLEEKVIRLWQPCGFTKNLNQIMECGFEKKKTEVYWSGKKGTTHATLEQLKDPNARNLFTFLDTIFNN